MSTNGEVASISLETSNALVSIGQVEANKLPCMEMSRVSLASSAHVVTCRVSVSLGSISLASGNERGSCRAKVGNGLASI